MFMKKFVFMILVVVLGICVLSACSGEEVEPEGEIFGQKKESSADVSQFESVKDDMWRDSWIEELSEDAKVSVNLFAIVELPKLSQMSTVEVQRYLFNEENKKKLAESIFQGDLYYHDEANLPKTELEELIQAEEKQDGSKKLIKKYKKLLKKAPEDYVKAEGDYRVNKYMGERDGIRYELNFDESEEENVSTIELSACDEKDIYPESAEKGGMYQPYPFDIKREADNKCKMTKEEAEKLAGDFLQQTGFPDLIRTEEGTLGWHKYADESEDGSVVLSTSEGDDLVDGWYFNYAPGVDGVSFMDFNFSTSGYQAIGKDTIETVSFNQYSADCSITVEVTDRGIIEVQWRSPVVVMSKTPGVKLMPFDNVKKIIKAELHLLIKYFCEKKNTATMNFNRLSLIYYRVVDPDNENLFTYIPAWRLWDNNSGAPSFVVNAMDGSVVDDWEETWHITIEPKKDDK